MAYMGAPPPYTPAAEHGVFVNPPLPYAGQINPLSDGFTINITGRVLPKADRFYVNLPLGNSLQSKCDIAFHLNPRFRESVVVRNSFLYGAWGGEERNGPPIPLQPDQNFDLIILVTDASYKAAFNGQHFCDFRHRVAKERVSYLVIDGDIVVHQIKITDPRRPVGYAAPPPPSGYVGMGYPTGPQAYPPQGYPGAGVPGSAAPIAVHIHQTTGAPGYPTGPVAAPSPAYPHPRAMAAPPKRKTLPLLHEKRLPNGAVTGTVVRIQAMPTMSAKRFAVNFLTMNKQNIAFHFNPRFDEQVVVRNTKKGGVWGSEERQQPYFPFRHGQEFKMVIFSDPEKFQVTVDDRNFVTYSHRIQDLHNIRLVQVEGDLDLYSLQL